MTFQDAKAAKDVEEDPPKGGNSNIGQATFNMTKTIVGAGIFGLPMAYQKAGFVTVTLCIVVLAYFFHWTLTVLLTAGLKAKVSTYQDLMEHCFDKWGRYSYALFAFFVSFGCMAAYTIILADSLPIVLRAMMGVADENATLTPAARVLCDRRVVVILCSFLIMLPISSVRDISKLAKFSIFAMCGIFLMGILIIVGGVQANDSLKGSRSNVFSVFKLDGIYGAIGTLCFAYVCHHNTFIIFRSLKKPTLKNFGWVNTYSLSIAALMSLVVGVSGYMIFTDKIRSNVLNCFSNTDVYANICRAFFAVDMLLTYPLELYVCRNAIFKVIYKDTRPAYWLHLLLSIVLVSSTAMIGVYTCDLGAAFDLTGGVGASAIAFIFPAACSIKLNGGNIFAIKNIKYTLCTLFGMLVLVATSWHTLYTAIATPSPVECKFITL